MKAEEPAVSEESRTPRDSPRPHQPLLYSAREHEASKQKESLSGSPCDSPRSPSESPPDTPKWSGSESAGRQRGLDRRDTFRSTYSGSRLEYDPVDVGCATLISILPDRERNCLQVDTHSVYGAFVAMPQLARTANWPSSMTVCVRTAAMYMIVNLMLQASLLYFIAKEDLIMDKFAGKVNLCDFGAMIHTCPEDEHGKGIGDDHCLGPGGTLMGTSRMYNFNSWQTREYVRQAFQDIFPEMKEEITRAVDPGEYGVESWWCRVLCVFLLMLEMIKDLTGTIDLTRLLWHTPSTAEPWIQYRNPDWAPSPEFAKEITDFEELDFVDVKIAGMPTRWKIINFVCVVIPKVLLFKMTAENGTTLLMETTGMEDVIVNSTALTFVLTIDELIYHSFISDTTKQLMLRLQPFAIYDADKQRKLTHEDALLRLNKEVNQSIFSDIRKMIPKRLLMTFCMTALFIFGYYTSHCTYVGDFHWISKAMYLPRGTSLSFAKTVFPRFFTVQSEEEPYWTFQPAQ